MRVAFLNAILVVISIVSTTWLAGAQTMADSAQSLLWKVSSPELKKPSYLFGTIHMICKEDYLWTEQMQKSLDASDKVCFELDLDDPGIMHIIALGMMDKSGKQLKEYFTEEEYKLLSSYVNDSLGMNINMFQHLKPTALISVFSSQTVTCSTPLSYEYELMNLVKEKEQAEIIGLEEAKEQLALFDRIPTDTVIHQLLDMINNNKTATAEYYEMVEAYKSQNLQKLHQIIETSDLDGDTMKQFLDDRNRKWVERMVEAMEQGSIFFAVGAGHLLGNNGLISLLQQEGYTLTPIK